MKLLVKDIQIKTLVSGDKSARIILETLDPSGIPVLARLADATETDVYFVDIEKIDPKDEFV